MSHNACLTYIVVVFNQKQNNIISYVGLSVESVFYSPIIKRGDSLPSFFIPVLYRLDRLFDFYIYNIYLIKICCCLLDIIQRY